MKKIDLLFLVLVLLLMMVPFRTHAEEDTGSSVEETTLDEELGTTREKVVAFLSSHESDDYYLGTPFRDFSRPWNAEWCERPYGRFADNEPQMNCTGFVADVLIQSGVKEQALIDMARWDEENGYYYDTDGGGYVDADYWFYFAMFYPGLRSYTFSSVEEALASGVLQKGDIILFQPLDYVLWDGYDQYGNEADPHIGFFWGETPEDDRFWNSNVRGAVGISGAQSLTMDGNQISQISGCCESVVVVIPLSDPVPEEEEEEEEIPPEPEEPEDILDQFIAALTEVDAVIGSAGPTDRK